MNNIYKLTLVGPLRGYYLLVVAPSELAVRRYAAKNVGRLWCSVYAADEPISELPIGATIYLNEDGEDE
jgi:hypothetical protein